MNNTRMIIEVVRRLETEKPKIQIMVQDLIFTGILIGVNISSGFVEVKLNSGTYELIAIEAITSVNLQSWKPDDA